MGLFESIGTSLFGKKKTDNKMNKVYQQRANARSIAEKRNGGMVAQQVTAKDPIGFGVQSLIRGVQNVGAGAEGVRKLVDRNYSRPLSPQERKLSVKK